MNIGKKAARKMLMKFTLGRPLCHSLMGQDDQRLEHTLKKTEVHPARPHRDHLRRQVD